MKTTIVLAMHGAPPNDFPRDETAELFSLHGRLDHAPEAQRPAIQRRYAELDAKVRAWPRTPQNDPFWAASLEMGERLSQAASCEVVVGFNEFCNPTLDEALEQAVATGVERVVVVTPMMTRGGEHSEEDIPEAIERVQQQYPDTSFHYVWPFDVEAVAGFLAGQVAPYILED